MCMHETCQKIYKNEALPIADKTVYFQKKYKIT